MQPTMLVHAFAAKHVIAHLDEEKAEGVENEAVEQVRSLHLLCSIVVVLYVRLLCQSSTHVTVLQRKPTISVGSNQIAFADKVILNKMDLVSEAEAANVEKRIRSLNASARVSARDTFVSGLNLRGCLLAFLPRWLADRAFDQGPGGHGGDLQHPRLRPRPHHGHGPLLPFR
jgi:G3E family GTPase